MYVACFFSFLAAGLARCFAGLDLFACRLACFEWSCLCIITDILLLSCLSVFRRSVWFVCPSVSRSVLSVFSCLSCLSIVQFKITKNQVAEMTRVIAVTAGKALPASQLSMLSARSRNVLTTGDCPVYKLFLRRTLSLLRHTLVEGGMSEDRFIAALRKVGGGRNKRNGRGVGGGGLGGELRGG